MTNFYLWEEIYQRLQNIPDYQWGAVVTLPESLGGEERFYFQGGWWEPSYAALFPDQVVNLGVNDIFPENPERD